jgi:cytidine deaminase
MKKLIELATQAAISSKGVGSNSNYRVGAVLFDKRERVYACKFNSYKTHPILCDFTTYPHLHAESSCILHHGLDNCSELSLLVVRVRHPNNKLTMAKPCKVCNHIISEVGISHVYFSNWSGIIDHYKVN